MSVETINTISPTTNKCVVTRSGVSDAELQALPVTATEAFLSFRKTTLAQRQDIVKKALKIMSSRRRNLPKKLQNRWADQLLTLPKRFKQPSSDANIF